ncbi:MAG: LysM peptidoglycan-binding domain-containing protein [Nitrospinae bacterium]|nr:LysM peptidoglycan-binding domain-containing protein [Nitrospinota bacterium]
MLPFINRSHSVEGIYHTVQKKQTLYQIARRYNINMKLLQDINYIQDPSKIQAGTQLWIPGAQRVLQIHTLN